MGSTAPSESRPVGSPNVDPHRRDLEGPANDVTLAPFFISKHEVTQGQFKRVMGYNPSYLTPETTGDHPTNPVTERHPVETVTWDVARAFAMRIGCELPTEAQWEYACRAGTTTIYATGDDAPSLSRHANLQDKTRARNNPDAALNRHETEDGFSHYAPVGSFTPNAFGLHDMHGNVGEWCRDFAADYTLPAQEGDGYRPGGEDTQMHCLRGGAFDTLPLFCRSASRLFDKPNSKSVSIGIRVVRALER
jgi:formylglycine-generating enzyme required for sulfatase activity